MTEMTDEKVSSMLGKIRALLAKAESTEFPEEADTLRQKAEALMLKYRIEESMAINTGISSTVPGWRDFRLDVGDSEFAQWYYKLTGIVARHCDVKVQASWAHDEELRKTVVNMESCGYSGDLNYMDMLLTACMMEFGKRLEPKYDPTISDEDNVYNMRSAGMERRRIALAVLGSWDTINEMKAKTRKVTAMFRAACEKRGEEADVLLGRGNNVKAYREDYADGFVNTISVRLMRLREGNLEVGGGGLVLASRKEKVVEAYYTRYPQERPKASGGTWTDPRQDCDKCKKAKSGYCRDHSYLRPSTAQPRGRLINGAARRRGGDAASMVDLGPNATGRGRVSQPSRGQIG